MPPITEPAAAPVEPATNGKATEPEQQPDTADLDALRAEVAAEPATTPAADDDTWPRPIPIGDVTVRVKHYLDWPLDSDQHLANVDITTWARDILAGDDFDTIWRPEKPTLRQGLKFVKAVEVAVGIPFAPHLDSLTN